jgi:hypothetical protein
MRRTWWRLVGPLTLAAVVGMGAWTAARADEPGAPAKPAAKAAAKPAAKKSAKATEPKSPKEAAAEILSGPEVRNFQAFCDEWMQKLRDRETYNNSHITWENKDGRVSGEYTGYGTDKTCVAREEPGKDPIGKINYRETRYRREGATQAEAMAAPGTVVEQEDVTEIFRYAKGRWQY